MREGDSREGIRKRGEDLEGGLSFWGEKEEGKEEEEKKEEIGGEKIVLGDFYRGTVVAGNFGLGGQETTRIPRARELERLFLVGWEVNIQFWVVWARTRANEQGAKSTRTCRSRYVFY
jgi:hypothetical protein